MVRTRLMIDREGRIHSASRTAATSGSATPSRRSSSSEIERTVESSLTRDPSAPAGIAGRMARNAERDEDELPHRSTGRETR